MKFELYRKCPECVQSNGQVCYDGNTLEDCPCCKGIGEQVRNFEWGDCELTSWKDPTGEVHWCLEPDEKYRYNGWIIREKP